MGFNYNSETGAMTASMYLSVLKVLATFCIQGEEELGVMFVKDTVRNAGTKDATVDLDIRSIVGLGRRP